MKASSRSGVICTPHTLATDTGHDVLRDGGTAIDAVLAAGDMRPAGGAVDHELARAAGYRKRVDRAGPPVYRDHEPGPSREDVDLMRNTVEFELQFLTHRRLSFSIPRWMRVVLGCR